jgi:UDPglucose 6-dehydrogenase
MLMTVSGLGVLGLTQALHMAKLGHTVLGVDVNPSVVKNLSNGVVPFFEPSLQSELRKYLKAGNITFSEHHSDFSKEADIHWICVDIPISGVTSEPDLTNIFSATDILISYIKTDGVVAVRSSVPAGTCHQVKRAMDYRLNHSVDFHIVVNPEFNVKGVMWKNFPSNGNIIVGAESEKSRVAVEEAYNSGRKNNFMWTDIMTAELIKNAHTAYLNVQSSFINSLNDVAEASSINIQTLIKGLNLAPHINDTFMNTVGYHPESSVKDFKAFIFNTEKTGEYQMNTLLTTSDNVNSSRTMKAFKKAKNMLDGDLVNKNIIILGGTSAPNTDNVEDSYALQVASMLHKAGAKIKIHDVKGIKEIKKAYPFFGTFTKHDNLKIYSDADLIIFGTPWEQYKTVNPEMLSEHVREMNMLDLTGNVSHFTWIENGWNVGSLGGFNF